MCLIGQYQSKTHTRQFTSIFRSHYSSRSEWAHFNAVNLIEWWYNQHCNQAHFRSIYPKCHSSIIQFVPFHSVSYSLFFSFVRCDFFFTFPMAGFSHVNFFHSVGFRFNFHQALLCSNMLTIVFILWHRWCSAATAQLINYDCARCLVNFIIFAFDHILRDCFKLHTNSKKNTHSSIKPLLTTGLYLQMFEQRWHSIWLADMVR